MKVFLWGMMGSGKTSTGRQLAALLGCPWVDLDEEISRRAGMAIPEIFEEHGQVGFRQQEHTALKSWLADPAQDYVMSCGGGTPCFFDNAAQMNAHGTTCYLWADIDTLAERLSKVTTHRPLLQDATPHSLRNQLAHLLRKRATYYQQARHTQDTTHLSTQAVAQVLHALLSQ